MKITAMMIIRIQFFIDEACQSLTKVVKEHLMDAISYPCLMNNKRTDSNPPFLHAKPFHENLRDRGQRKFKRSSQDCLYLFVAVDKKTTQTKKFVWGWILHCKRIVSKACVTVS